MGNILKGKVALITGGGEGIGLAAAKRIIAEGATVFIVGRRQAVLDQAVAEIGGGVVALQADVSKRTDLERVYESVRSSKGKLEPGMPAFIIWAPVTSASNGFKR